MRAIIVSLVALGLLSAAQAADPPVAKIGNRTISRAELEKRLKSELLEIDMQRYEALHEGLEEMIADELIKQEAQARGVTPEALTKTEIEDKAAKPTDDQAMKLYDANKDKLGNASFESVKPRIIDHLKQGMIEERKEAFVTELKKKYKTEVSLRPPVIEVGTGGRSSRGGGPNAPVTMIEFSDYECPFCKRADETVQQVMKTYGDKVRLVHRDFPLSIHNRARPAAEAARCAEAQGKFWDYHTKLFASQDLSPEKLQALATEVGLDRAKFDECVAKPPFKDSIDKDIADGTDAGVTGTPAFFINGRMLSGAQPFEKFKEVIDEELARGPGAKPS
jgi:protein-disulfide isomerase/ribosomal protein L12E/L44/L45/RPP1/RPP2